MSLNKVAFCVIIIIIIIDLKKSVMNKFTFLAFALFISLGTLGQSDVVNWKFESKKISGNKHEVKFTAFIKIPWHIYSTTQAEGGPEPTKITFTKNPLATPEGSIKEIG